MYERWGSIQQLLASVSRGFIKELIISSADDAVLIGTRVMSQYVDDVLLV